MFIIQKRDRLSPEQGLQVMLPCLQPLDSFVYNPVRPMAAYFVMNNRIYQSPDVYTVLSNRLVSASQVHTLRILIDVQLTSLCSLQSSLDILRKHRPDYTPRTGFVWPIVDPSIPDDATRKRISEEEGPSQTSSGKDKPATPQGGVKRQKNDNLLLNAMRATALHSKTSVSSNTLALSAENLPEETPGPSMATPAPTPSQGEATPQAVPPQPNEVPAKAPAGAGKKKKKRV